METRTPPIPTPRPPPFALPTDLEGPDEHDVELTDDDLDLPSQRDDDGSTRTETVEFMGSGYASLADYFCRALEDLIDPSIHWILTMMDMKAVQRRFEADRYRYIFESGAVYRTGASQGSIR